VIVVIGSPTGRQTEQGIEAAGVAATVGRVAAAAGAQVQLVGKVGEGVVGDAVLLSVARSGVGHVAVLRDASAVTPVALSAPDPKDILADDESATGEPEGAHLTLDSGDLELALRYLPDYRVVVVANALDEPALGTVVAAARWAGAQLIVVVPAGSSAAGVPEDATVLESPDVDPDGAFGAVVGAYAAALDRGAAPAEAFASASAGSGWSAVVD
jgi:sugar/nucleoside kinase (ribokinase family)